MAGLIKKQVLKLLTKFTSGLQPEDIQLSSLKGEAELRNILLDNEALQDLLDLPTWIRINEAKVNCVTLKIQWTSLQSKPIRICFDQIQLEAEAIQEPRAPNGPSPIQDLASSNNGSGSYGFTEKVFDGIRLEINTVLVKFSSVAFSASLSVQQIIIFSARENWTQSTDLRETRKQNEREVVTRKKIQWSSVRIEATWQDAAPVRLITNQGEIRIMLRRRLSDCAVIANRVEVILDDLLWILTDRQIQATLLCVKSLSEAIEASKQQSFRNQRSNSEMSIVSEINTTNASPIQQLIESSHHFSINRLDLHICEESVQASAVQVTLTNMALDYYPARKAAKSRKDFVPYTEAMMARDKWIEPILQKFRDDFKRLRAAAKPMDKITKLKENVLVFKLFDLEIYQVSSPTRQNTSGSKLLTSSRSTLNLPTSMPFIHFESTDYFTPDGRDYPMPHNNIYVQINALLFEFDFETIVWFHKIYSEANETVQNSLRELGINAEDSVNYDHQDIRCEIIMPTIVLDTLEISSSQIIFSNFLDIGQLTTLGNFIDIYKFINKDYSLPAELLTPYINVINETDRPIDRYINMNSKPELCREAMIQKKVDEIAVIQIDKLWIEQNKKQLLDPLSIDVYYQLHLTLCQFEEVNTSVCHEQLTSLFEISQTISKLQNIMGNNGAVNNPADHTNDETSTEKSNISVLPRVEVIGKGIVANLELVPFSSLSCDVKEKIDIADPLSVGDYSSCGSKSPYEMPCSTLQAVISPLIINIIFSENAMELSLLSQLQINSRNYRGERLKKMELLNINGSTVLEVLSNPHVSVHISPSSTINVRLQDCSLSILTSVFADIGPFLESPIAPAADGSYIFVSLHNITIKPDADQKTFYKNSLTTPIEFDIHYLHLSVNPDGSISILKNESQTDETCKYELQLIPPLRPSIPSKTASTQTIKTDHSSDALIELQERNLCLQRERHALTGALEKMQDELIRSEERSEIYRSQLQAMQQLITHQKRQ